MRTLKSKSQYEFLIKEVTTSYNTFTLQFLQDNMYNQNPYGNSWWNCLQQNASQGYGTGPWQLGYNGLSVSIFQR